MSTLTAEQVEVAANPRALYELSLAESWGDGAPLLPPTDDVVQALLDATPYPADHVVGALPPKYGVATVELVAINAAMAGCEPAALPFVLAALEALLVPEWNAFGLTTTTSSVFPLPIVNGPSRDALGIDYRAGCMGGAIVDAGVAILSFIMGSNTLIAISAKEGSVLWKQPIGDVLLKIPERVGAQWLVASKNNRILLLNSADGSIAADVRWPTWLVDIAAATLDGKTIILCTDIRGQLSLLDAATLKTSRQFVLPSRPHGELFVVPQFSGKFGVARTDNAPLAGADDINALLPLDEIDGKRMPAVLVTDADGFCYIVPLK